MLRVVSWNMQGAFGGTARQERAWHYLLALDPDVALLQEARPPSWVRDIYHCLHRAQVGSWCSMIATKNASLERILDGDGVSPAWFDRYVVVADANLSGRSIRFASVHTPASRVDQRYLVGLDAAQIRRPSVPDVWYNDQAFWILRRELATPFIVSGDWNTARRFDDFPKMYGVGSGEFFSRAEEHKWNECLRKFHEQEQRTFFQKRKGPYELDHAFCSADLIEQLRDCYVEAHAAEKLELSDHAPIVMEFDL